MDIHHCIIIGSGPAGYTAAIYAARANMHPILFTGAEPGGQLMITTEVENFPGYPNGIHGPQLMDDLQKQAERFETQVRYEKITGVDFTGPIHKVWTESGEVISAHAVIISTGASAKWLGIDSEKRLMNKGVSACAVCDGFFFKGKEVAIVGGGDTAAEEASYLAKLCPKVHLLVRKDHMRASKIMQERVQNTANIQIHWNSETVEILGEDGVTGIRIRLDMDDQGYLVTKPGTTQTNVAGVFACGDVQDRIYRQAVTAAGTGCMAALDAERYLTNSGII